MDLQQLINTSSSLIPIFFLTTALLFAALLLTSLFKSKSESKPTKLPPGPSKLPIIGSLHHLLFSLPQHKLRDLALLHGPVMLLRLGQVDNVVISSGAAAEDVFKTHDLSFACRPVLAAPTTLSYNCTSISFSPYGDYWRQLKKILVRELLTSQRVKSFSSLRHQEVSNLLKGINNEISGPINASSKFRELFNTLVARAAFGDKCRQQKRFIETTKEGLRHLTGFNVADLFPSLGYVDVLSGMRSRLERAHREFDRILGEIIEDHRQKVKNEEEEEEDLVDVLLKVKERGDLEIPITIDNLKAVILVRKSLLLFI